MSKTGELLYYDFDVTNYSGGVEGLRVGVASRLGEPIRGRDTVFVTRCPRASFCSWSILGLRATMVAGTVATATEFRGNAPLETASPQLTSPWLPT